MYRVTPRGFERLVGEIWRTRGFRVELTPETRDGGYDLFAIKPGPNGSDEVELVECKRLRNDRRVGVDVVRRAIGVCQIENATRSVIVTTASFTVPAKRAAATQHDRMKLCEGSELMAWLRQFAPQVPSVLRTEFSLPLGDVTDKASYKSFK